MIQLMTPTIFTLHIVGGAVAMASGLGHDLITGWRLGANAGSLHLTREGGDGAF